MVQRTRRYLIRRVVVVLLTLFVVTLLSFLLMRLSPIDPATAYVKRNSAIVTQEQIDEARVMLGLDKPLPVQYFDWVVDALHMDFGISLGTGNPVTEELAKTVPVTLTVVAYSAVIMSLGVLGVGMLGYLWRQKAGGMILSFLTMIGISVPGSVCLQPDRAYSAAWLYVNVPRRHSARLLSAHFPEEWSSLRNI